MYFDVFSKLKFTEQWTTGKQNKNKEFFFLNRIDRSQNSEIISVGANCNLTTITEAGIKRNHAGTKANFFRRIYGGFRQTCDLGEMQRTVEDSSVGISKWASCSISTGTYIQTLTFHICVSVEFLSQLLIKVFFEMNSSFGTRYVHTSI